MPKNNTSTEFEYKKMTKFVIDMKDLKQDAEGNFIRDSFTRSGFIDGEWVKIPDACYYDVEFKNFIIKNFNADPDVIEDEGKTHYFFLKEEPMANLNTVLKNIELTFDEESSNEGDVESVSH